MERVMDDPWGAVASGRSGASSRFDELYRSHHRSIRDYCRRRVGPDQVDDAVAETFLVAWRRLDDVPCGDGELLWLYAVAHRVVGHEWRRGLRRRRLDLRLRASSHPDAGDVVDDALVATDELAVVLRAAARLGATDAEVLRLSAWEQLSSADIATVLGIAPNAVKQRLHRARRNLGREYRRLAGAPAPAPTVQEAPTRGVVTHDVSARDVMEGGAP